MNLAEGSCYANIASANYQKLIYHEMLKQTQLLEDIRNRVGGKQK